MATDRRKDPTLQAELDVVARLAKEQTADFAAGSYGLTAMSLVDAHNNGVPVPLAVKEIIGDWEAKNPSERYGVQSSLHTWMQQHPAPTDRVAAQYYEKVVRPRAGGSAPLAAMAWADPGATLKDLDTLGMKASDLAKDPHALGLFIDHVSKSGSPDRQHRMNGVKQLIPLMDYSRMVDPPTELPLLPQPNAMKVDVPYPSMHTNDPWMQYGHAAHAQEELEKHGDILGASTMRAAVQLRTAVDRDTHSRRLLSRAYGSEAVEPADSPLDTALDFGVAPYGLAKATADVIQSQFAGDLSLTERLEKGVFAAPLIVGGIFASRYSNLARNKVRGLTETAEPAKVQEAKDQFTEKLIEAKQKRESAQKRVEDLTVANDQENLGKAKRELSQARREENFISTVLDNERGEAEIRRLQYWKQGLQESGASLKQIQDVDKKIETAQKRLVDAQDMLKMPTKAALDKAVETWQNLKKSAKVPDEQMHMAAEGLIKSGKVSLKTIMARDIDASLNPMEAQAEAMLANKVAEHVDALTKVYQKSEGSIVASHALVQTLNEAAVILGKVRRTDTRLGQSVHALAGKSDANKALHEMVEGLDGMTLPAFTQVFQTAKTDIDRVSQLKKLSQPGVFKGSALQIITNNLISSPSTAIWNIASMGVMTVSRMNELRLLGKLDPSHFAQDEAGTFASALVGYYGRLISGDVKAKAAWNEQFQKASLRSTGMDPGIETKYHFGSTISAKGLGITGSWGRAVDAIGYLINLPTQVSSWADAGVSVGIKDAMAKVLAHRQATLELNAEIQMGSKLSKDQIQTRMAAREQEILADPNSSIMIDGKAALIKDLATEDAAVISMMGKLQSQTLGGVEKWMNNSLLARMVIPFPHPFLQSLEMALERTPIGRLLPHMKADLAAGGARAASARAKLATGNQTAAVFAAFAGMSYLADSEGESDWIGFTGSGPFREGQKSLWAATHRADTLRVAGKEFPLSKLGPPGQIMSMTADIMGLINEGINAGDKEFTTTALDLTARLTAAWTNLAVSELFAADVKDIMHGLVEGNAAAIERVIERKSTMVVPAGAALRDFNNIYNDTKVVFDSSLDQMKHVAPLNFWGDPVRYYGTQNPLSTLVGLTERNAPQFDRKNRLAETLIADDVAVTAPGKSISVSGVSVDLSLEQMYAMREFFAHAKLDGKTLLEGLEGMVNSPLYKQLVKGSGTNDALDTRMAKGSKQDYINMYIAARKKAATAWMLSPETIPGSGFDKSPWGAELQQRVTNSVQTREWDLSHPSTVPQQRPGTGTFEFAQ